MFSEKRALKKPPFEKKFHFDLFDHQADFLRIFLSPKCCMWKKTEPHTGLQSDAGHIFEAQNYTLMKKGPPKASHLKKITLRLIVSSSRHS